MKFVSFYSREIRETEWKSYLAYTFLFLNMAALTLNDRFSVVFQNWTMLN